MAIGPWHEEALSGLCLDVLGAAVPGTGIVERKPRWLAPLVRAVLAAFSSPPTSDEQVAAVALFIASRQGFCAAFHGPDRPRVARWLAPLPSMGVMPWPVPVARTTAELAELLEVEVPELEWLGDVRQYCGRAQRSALTHYHSRWLAKPNGGHRLLESPKPLLKVVQRRVLQRILNGLPVHPCAHGFVRGRSAVSHARQHAGRAWVLRLDLEDFFTSIPAGRVFGVFRAAGYPREVARLLAGLCTTALPLREFAQVPKPTLGSEVALYHRLRIHARQRHLPQGAPTSPALANLCALGLDRRLLGAANRAGMDYSRYADDLAFSAASESCRLGDFATFAAAIAIREGFNLNFRKTRLLPQSTGQRLCGVTINVHPNVPRKDYDRLKAILTNCKRHGVASQNREQHRDFRAHLRGRVAWMQAICPARGAKLQQLFETLDWEQAEAAEVRPSLT